MPVLGCGAQMSKLMDVSDQDVAVIEEVITERLAMGVSQVVAQRQAVAEAIVQLDEERSYVMGQIEAQLGVAPVKESRPNLSTERNDGVPMFANKAFFSALAKGVEALSMKAAPAGGWKDAIKGMINKGLIKQDEVEWSGLNDWLELQTGKVTRDQVTQYLDVNGVQVNETTLGGEKAWVVRDENGKMVNAYDTEEEAQELADDLGDDNGDYYAVEYGHYQGGEPKYDQYNLPGGENYREVLLTLPTGAPTVIKRMEVVERPDGNFDVVDDEGVVKSFREWGDAQRFAYDTEQSALIKRNQVNNKAYKSAHWEQLNVLTHIRVDDRTDADGSKVLMVQEIQSDWGQDGKKKGFKQDVGPAEQAYREYEVGLKARFDAMLRDDLGSEFKDPAKLEKMVKAYTEKTDSGAMAIALGEKPTLNEYSRAWNDELRKNAERTPAAPFVTNTQGWLNLALKRVITMAVQGGYDKVAFVNGEQSADRYDLSKQIEKIEYEQRPNSLYSFVAFDKQMRRVADETDVDAGRVEQMMGKELAAKIVAGDGLRKDAIVFVAYNTDGIEMFSTPSERDMKEFSRVYEGDLDIQQKRPRSANIGSLSGLDLKVGGEGMRKFYDSIVPNAASALLKKLGGGKMEMVRFNNAEVEQVGRSFQVTVDGEVKKFSSYQNAMEYLTKFGDTLKQQPGFTLTPALREKAAGGLPMFSNKVSMASEEVAADPKDSHGFRLAVEQITRDRYAGKPPIAVRVGLTGDTVFVSWSSAKHILRDGNPDWKTSLAVLHMEDLAENATKVSSFARDYKGRKDPTGAYTYTSEATINEEPHTVEIVVRQHSDGKRYYDHLVVETKTPAGLPESSASSVTTVDEPTPPYAGVDNSIGPNEGSVKAQAYANKPTDWATTKWTDASKRVQFKPGAWLYQRMGAAVTPLLNYTGMKAMSPELKRQVRHMKLAVEQAQELSAKIAIEAFKLSPDEREMVSHLIEKTLKPGVVPPAHAVRLAALISNYMDIQSKELVSLGMLTQDAVDRWKGIYLPRFYLKKLHNPTDSDAWADAINGMMRRAGIMKGIKGKSLRSRGMFETIDPSQLQDYLNLGWEVRDPDYKAGASSQVQVWRDFTPDEREKMGEIKDAGFRFVMGYMQTQRDIALGRMFVEMANDANLSSRLPTKELTVQVPMSKVAGTGAHIYGQMAGRWVSQETLSHLSSFEEAHSDLLTAYRQALSVWKEGKTVLNPVSHLNNTVSNMTMAHLAGISYHRVDKYLAAVHDFTTKNHAGIAEAKAAGLFLGSFNQAELSNAMPDELKNLAKMQEGLGIKTTRTVMNIMTLGLRNSMGKAYQFEDSFYKYMIYKDARSRGMSQDDAVDYAQKYIFTYDDLPKGARRIRDFAIPFFSYTYKAAPVLLETAMTHPVRMAVPAALMYGLMSMGYAFAVAVGDEPWDEIVKKFLTDEDFRAQADKLREEDQAALPVWMRGHTAFGTVKTLRVGFDKTLDLPVFLDVSRLIPGGDLFDVTNNAGGVSLLQPLIPSHPMIGITMAMLGNRDMFSGKDVVDKNDTTGEAAEKRLAWLYKQVAPAMAVGGYHFDRAMNTVAQASGGEITWLPEVVSERYTGMGRDGLPVTPEYSAPQTFGIKVRPIDLDKARQIETAMDRKLITEIDAEIRQLKRLNNQGVIGDKAYDKQLELQQTKKQRLKDGLTVDGDTKD